MGDVEGHEKHASMRSERLGARCVWRCLACSMKPISKIDSRRCFWKPDPAETPGASRRKRADATLRNIAGQGVTRHACAHEGRGVPPHRQHKAAAPLLLQCAFVCAVSLNHWGHQPPSFCDTTKELCSGQVSRVVARLQRGHLACVRMLLPCICAHIQIYIRHIMPEGRTS